MKVTCGAEVAIAGQTVSDLRDSLASFPADALLKSIGFDDGKIRVWWEEDR